MRRILVTALAFMFAPAAFQIHAQTPPPAVAAQAAPLGDYAGTYADGPGHKVELVAGDTLIAVIDDAQYPLTASGPDEFTNRGGGRIPFTRDASGKVTGYTDDGQFHARLSDQVSPETLELASAKPRGDETAASYVYHEPTDLHDGIKVGDIAKTDLGVATAKAVVGSLLDGTYRSVHSVLLYENGKLILEEYFYGYTADRQQQLRSASKSFVSALAGIAIGQGYLTSADEPVVAHLPYASYDNPDPRKSRITIGNVLSMSSGLACNDYDGASPGREEVIDDQPDWVKATLDLPQLSVPGTVAHYCSGGVAVVGRVVENATHMALPDFARKNLFRPLGIADSDWSWNYDLTNADKEYSQLHLRPRDMLKLGITYADGGRWHGRQVVPKQWVEESLSPLVQLDGTGYSYFWWHPYLNVQMPGGMVQVHYSSAQGNGGQKIYILPQYHLVAVFTGGDYNSSGSPPNKIMSKIILPILLAAHPSK